MEEPYRLAWHIVSWSLEALATAWLAALLLSLAAWAAWGTRQFAGQVRRWWIATPVGRRGASEAAAGALQGGGGR